MKKLYSILMTAVMACLSLSANADELTVTGLSSSAAGGIVLTFSQDVKVTHSAFGTRCYNEIIDQDAAISTLNAKPTTNGNVVTLTAQYCTFVDGHRIHLALNPECFTTLDGSVSLTGDTEFDFVMGEGLEKEDIVATLITPSNGTRTRLDNITITFDPNLSSITNQNGISVENEEGHKLPLIRVEVLREGGVALNINIDSDVAEFQGGTTYKVHIAPESIICGGKTNTKELVYGEWYIKPAPLPLVSTPAGESIVESVKTVTIAATDGEAFDYVGTNPADIKITGVMEDQVITYASAVSVEPNDDNTLYTITFDNEVTPEVIADAHPLYNSVKILIPEGTFKRGKSVNNTFQSIWTIQHTVVLGEITWTFSPASGSTVPALGNERKEETDTGTRVAYYLGLRADGENAFISIPDASVIKLVNEETGSVVMTFDTHDVADSGNNIFTLDMSKQITQSGEYTLIIPADAVYYYTDVNHYSEPQHPANDIEATWTVANPNDGILTITVGNESKLYDLQGRQTLGTQKGLYIHNGKKVIK